MFGFLAPVRTEYKKFRHLVATHPWHTAVVLACATAGSAALQLIGPLVVAGCLLGVVFMWQSESQMAAKH